MIGDLKKQSYILHHMIMNTIQRGSSQSSPVSLIEEFGFPNCKIGLHVINDELEISISGGSMKDR